MCSSDLPSFDRIRFFATAPDASGAPWLRLPATFDLEDPMEYFQTDIVARQTRALNRACWNAALKRAPTVTENRKAGEISGSKGSEPNPAAAPGTAKAGKPPPLIGPNLTADEAKRSFAHAPKTKDGSQSVCWDAGTHRGCHMNPCRNAHAPLGNPALLDATVQMQLARRGGVKTDKKLDATQATQRIQQLRQGIQEKAAADKKPSSGGRRAGAPAPKARPAPVPGVEAAGNLPPAAAGAPATSPSGPEIGRAHV